MSYEPKRSALRPGSSGEVVPSIGGQAEVANHILRDLTEDNRTDLVAAPDAMLSVPPEREHLISAARRLIRLRKLRRSYLPTKELGEPAWDLLLVIYAYEHASRDLRIADLASGADLAQTTALRTLQRLIRDGLVDCQPNPLDRRSVIHRLTASCRRGLDRYFEAVEIAFSDDII